MNKTKTLSPNLLSQCREILEDCQELNSYNDLKAVFNTKELKPFKSGIKSADNSRDLAALCIDYLIDQCTSDGQEVLPIFIKTLSGFYKEGDQRREILHKLYMDVKFEISPKEVFFSHLIDLDFEEQTTNASRKIKSERVASFYIHGKSEFPQQVLLKRLIYSMNPGEQNTRKITIDISKGNIVNNLSVWQQVAKWLQMDREAPPEKIADELCELWKTQDVVFILNSCICKDLIIDLIEGFWEPLANKAFKKRNSTEKHLLMFMVDYQDFISQWKVIDYLQKKLIHPPIALSTKAYFNLDILTSWLMTAAEYIPTELNSKILFEQSNGIPQLFYDLICYHCSPLMEGEFKKWLA